MKDRAGVGVADEMIGYFFGVTLTSAKDCCAGALGFALADAHPQSLFGAIRSTADRRFK